MAQVITVFLAGNSPEDALTSFIWDEAEEASQYAKENGIQYVYDVKMAVDVDDLDIVMDLDAEPEGI